ncbi:MAG: zinc ABC transporter substrate-binding protein [Mycobacterium sp.]|nr:zinc ABC transporter substrate-binding protein [Mycobacterium sp.]
MRALVAAGAAALLTVAVAGCSQNQQDAGSGDASGNGPVNVVASTDVWGSVASAVAGDDATVTAIVTGTVADPHSFEASPSDAANISDASLVVFNGGHYDHWVEEVLANNPDVPTVDGYSLLAPSQEPANEHVFYDLGTVKAVAAGIAEKLGDADAAHAADYTANAERFGQELDTIAAPGRLRNAGITDKTPETFADAVEEGDDPSPADVAAMLDLIDARQVSAVVVNTQTETSATQQISDAARQASLPLIEVTETLPEGLDYLSWQRATVDEIAAQLDSAPQTSR